MCVPGMDPSVYDMMKSLRAAKAAQASGEKVTVKTEEGARQRHAVVRDEEEARG